MTIPLFGGPPPARNFEAGGGIQVLTLTSRFYVPPPVFDDDVLPQPAAPGQAVGGGIQQIQITTSLIRSQSFYDDEILAPPAATIGTEAGAGVLAIALISQYPKPNPWASDEETLAFPVDEDLPPTFPVPQVWWTPRSYLDDDLLVLQVPIGVTDEDCLDALRPAIFPWWAARTYTDDELPIIFAVLPSIPAEFWNPPARETSWNPKPREIAWNPTARETSVNARPREISWNPPARETSWNVRPR